AWHALVVGIVLPPGVHGPTGRVDEDRIVVVILADPVSVDLEPVDVFADVLEHEPKLTRSREQMMTLRGCRAEARRRIRVARPRAACHAEGRQDLAMHLTARMADGTMCARTHIQRLAYLRSEISSWV